MSLLRRILITTADAELFTAFFGNLLLQYIFVYYADRLTFDLDHLYAIKYVETKDNVERYQMFSRAILDK